jgi:hypothetical protein
MVMLGAHKSSAAGGYNVYTCPTGEMAEVNVSVYNNSSSTNKIVLYRGVNATPVASETIQYNNVLPASGYERTAIVLSENEILSYSTDQIGTHIIVHGNEYTKASNEVLQRTLISSSTEVTVYPNSSSKAGTLNCSVCMVGTSVSSDTATVALYLTTSNASSGYLLYKQTLLTSANTGFDKSGIAIGTNDKLVVVTTGVVGSVAVCVSGYSK